MSSFRLKRLGTLMEPEPGNPQEVEGVLNPAAVRGPDGQLYIFPRLVAQGNFSRIGIARVQLMARAIPAESSDSGSRWNRKPITSACPAAGAVAKMRASRSSCRLNIT